MSSPTDFLSSVVGGFFLPPDPDFDNNTEITVAQGSSLESAELNLRYWVSMPPGPFDVSILVGAYIAVLDLLLLFGMNQLLTP